MQDLRNTSKHETERNPRLSIVWRDQADPLLYEHARLNRVFNHRRVQRYPRAIILAKRELDILAAVKLAIEQKCRISVRAGGHSWPAWSVRDDSILVDLGQYSELSFDRISMIACASPSTTSKELCEYLLSSGRMFPVGHCPDVGLGGFLLCGGMGWNSNNWGWACQHIVAVDVVTASGELIQANAEQNSDLLWAARGGGPGFPGIITRFHLQTILAPKLMRSSNPFDDLEIAAIGSYPPGADEPHLTITILAVGDSADRVQSLLHRADFWHPYGAVFRAFCEETTWSQQFRLKATAYPPAHRYCVDNAFLNNDADVSTILQRAFSTLPTKQSIVLYNSMIPESYRALPLVALSVQSAHYFAVYSIWKDEQDDAQNQAWVSDIMNDVGRHSVGAYTGEFDFQTRQSQFWDDEKQKQLRSVRRNWDPNGLFCAYLGLNDDT